ncbi:hypothetical protein FW778_12610 [Ginsengibacter hankyongi]|uniref:Uncharacterized protein n=1 Tax=Ginsengibacter hankyongi TaxID=2607284 RepID=A0A5J5IGT1_9BACT|nr:hypothetical protein [Ginsengibacter hankyongi]KAA9038406.1 hypothetical protein FW778_12610 [Ginsengibacter hankyongi]
MKWIMCLSGLWLITFCSCNLRERELELKNKMQEVNKKEQELSLKEKEIQLKEEQLNKREHVSDSLLKIPPDTLSMLHPDLTGTWAVDMLCTATTCAGSAVGDSKVEQWEISLQHNTVIANAINKDKVIRTYSGTYTGNKLELSSQAIDTSTSKGVQIIIRLKKTKENEMEGEREIIRPDDCHIIYDLQLKKK